MAAALVLTGCLVGAHHPSLSGVATPAALLALAAGLALLASERVGWSPRVEHGTAPDDAAVPSGGRALAPVALSLALLCVSVAWAARARAPGPDPLENLDGRLLLARGTVVEPPTSSRLLVRLDWAACDDREIPVAATRVLVRVSVPRTAAPRSWPVLARWGQSVSVVGRLALPASDDYAAWLAARDVRHVVEVRDPQALAVVQGRGLGLPRDLAARLRWHCEDAISAALPDPEASLLRGIVLGDGDALPRGDADAFRTTGTYHVVAASGLNVALVMLFAAGLAQGLRLPRAASVMLALSAVVLYALVAGASDSIVRAAWMAAVVQVGRALDRTADALAALSLAVVAMCVAEPRVVLDVGFAMSVACVAGMAVLTDPIERRMRRVPRWVRGPLAATVACQAAVAPIAAAAFQSLSLVGLVANLVVVPICEAALGAGLVLCALPAVLRPLLGPALHAGLALALATVHWMASWPLASVAVPAVTPVMAVTYWIALAWLAKLPPRRRPLPP